MASGSAWTESTLYRTIADELRSDIESGALAPGSDLPTEKELTERYRVSRNTVRLALNELTHDGLITSAQGRRRTVRRRDLVTNYASHIESIERRVAAGTDAFVDDMQEQHRAPGQHIEVAMVPAPAFVAERLGISVDEFVVVRRRVRLVDNTPNSIADSYYPRHIADGTAIMRKDDIPQGVIAYLAELGHVQTSFRDDLHTRMPTHDESLRLGTGPGIPVLVQLRTGYVGTEPIRVTRTIMPGDRNILVYELPA